MPSIHFGLNFSLVRNVIIVGNRILSKLYYGVFIITWIAIINWVIFNNKHIKTSESYQSTVNLKLKESILTNFSVNDFNTTYVKPEEFPYYNRVWDAEDISFALPEEIQIITNLVITPNQNQSVCPETPLIAGAICDPNKNHCKKGQRNKNGVLTGLCVPGDVPYQNDKHEWIYGHDCQLRGWCPVAHLVLPLKGKAAVLKDTQDSTLWVKNSILFYENNILFDNQPNHDIRYYLKCRFNPESEPNCPIFILKDILKYSENNDQTYEEMARYGAIINMKIDWNCFKYPFREFDSTKDCELKYSFLRIDDEKKPPATGYTSYRQTFLYNNGNTRTFWHTRRLVIKVGVEAKLGQYDLFRFISSTIGLYGAYKAIEFIFLTLAKIWLKRQGYAIDLLLNSPEIVRQQQQQGNIEHQPLLNMVN